MKNLILALALVAFGCNGGEKTTAPADVAPFFEAETPAEAAPVAPAEVAAEKSDPPPVAVTPDGADELNVYFEAVDDGDGKVTTYALQLVVEGVEHFPQGFSSFQIFKVATPECTALTGFVDGSLLGPGAYPFISHGVVDKARFGGYGASAYAIKTSGTLYKFFFEGLCDSGDIVLEGLRFSYNCTADAGNATACDLPILQGTVRHEF